MKLIYRGQIYYYDPSKAPERPIYSTPYTLHYRGVTYQVAPKSETAQEPVQSVNRSTYKLHYRGVTYLVNRNASGDAISAEDNSNRVTPKHNLLNFGATTRKKSLSAQWHKIYSKIVRPWKIAKN
jgi:Domain of unknown function (DUF4278)